MLKAAIAPSSTRTYDAGIKAYLQFCAATSTSPFPITEKGILRFIASAQRRLSYKSLKVYLAGVQFKSICMGFRTQIHSFSRVYYVLRGLRRLQGQKFTRPPRSPITLDHISQLRRYAKLHFSHPDDKMLTAAFLLAFFALLRASEYTSSESRHYDPDVTLRFDNICFDGEGRFVRVRIEKSKTDPFRLGCDLKVWATGEKLCAVKALKKFVKSHPFRQGPLFTFRDGSFLTRSRLESVVKAAIPDINLNTHSFRIGGASAAAAAGIPDSTIQVMGRWASNAYRTYLRMPDATFRRATRAMSQRLSAVPTWTPHDRA